MKKFFYVFLNIFVFLGMFIFLFLKLQNFYLANDDIVDITINSYIDHGRFFVYIINKFIIKILPYLLNMHIQDLNVILAPIIFSLNFIGLVFVIANSFYNFKQKDLLFPFIFAISFFIIFFFISILNFNECFKYYQFHMPYLFSIIFLILFINKLKQIYENNIYTKADIIKLTIFLVIAINGNEQISASITIGLLCLLINALVKKQNLKKIPYITFPLVISIFILLIINLNPYANNYIFDHFLFRIHDFFSKQKILGFIYVFNKKIILDNIYLWIMYVVSTIILFVNKNKKAKINLYFLLGYLLFFLSMYFAGESYAYYQSPDYNLYPRYLILHTPLLFGFKVFLYYAILSQIGYICSIFTKTKILLWLIIILIFTYIQYNRDFLNVELVDGNGRQITYTADKIAVFYFKKGKTAILPREDIDAIMPTSNNLMPKELEDEDYIGKVFTDYKYLEYIQKVYNVDSSKGMTFLPYEQAIQEFYNNGGVITEEELKELKFSKILEP